MNINSITKTAAVALADQVRHLESQGRNVIKLQTGEPDFNNCYGINEAAFAAIKAGETHYTHSNGMPVLRNAIANSLMSEGMEIDPECVLVTHGAAGAIGAAMAALIEYGDEVIIPEPNWPTADSMVKLSGGVPVKISLREMIQADVTPVLDRYATEKTKAIYINTPVNPTGAVIPQRILDTVCNWAMKRGIYVIADEVYRSLQYVENRSSSLPILKSYDRYIFVDSFSKKYAMTGWRVGYCISSAAVIAKIAKAVQVSSTCIAPFVQVAAAYALTGDDSQAYAEEMYTKYQQRRAEAISLCSELSLSVEPAEGAFYLFIKLPFGLDDVLFTTKLLDEYQVCAVPGSAFGPNGAGHVRITYAQDLKEVLSGIRVIDLVIKNFKDS